MTTRRKPQIPVVLRQRLATRSGDRRDRVERAAANHELRRQPQGQGDAAWASAISYVAECLRRVSRAMPLESAGSHPTQNVTRPEMALSIRRKRTIRCERTFIHVTSTMLAPCAKRPNVKTTCVDRFVAIHTVDGRYHLTTYINPETLTVRKSAARRRDATLLPEPLPARLHVPIVSVDDHYVEPGDLFQSRMSAKFRDRIPRVVETSDGVEAWQFEDSLEVLRGPISAVGRPREEWTMEPLRFDEMRAGSYDPVARLKDMDVAGVVMSLCFPSAPFGFAGQRFFRMKDHELGLAAMRAYNDWTIEEWVRTDPSRFIAQQVPWFPDPALAAAEIRRNAARGFRAVTFSENPEALGFPSIYTDFWDPFFSACEETGTVVNLHIGSSSQMNTGSTGAPTDVTLALFPVNAIVASVDWLYARIPIRFPGLKIVLSESGISWVPMIHERLRRNLRMAHTSESTWTLEGETPEEVFKRAFWFTSIEDPSGIDARHQVGIDRIMLEVDYPHPDSSWPQTQEVIQSELGHIPEGDVKMLAYENAAAVYSLSLPEIARIADRLKQLAVS